MLIHAYFTMPETKGKSLVKVEKEFEDVAMIAASVACAAEPMLSAAARSASNEDEEGSTSRV